MVCIERGVPLPPSSYDPGSSTFSQSVKGRSPRLRHHFDSRQSVTSSVWQFDVDALRSVVAAACVDDVCKQWCLGVIVFCMETLGRP